VKITFAKDVAALLKGSESLLVIAPQKSLKKMPKILGSDLDKLTGKLAKGLKPGDLGTTATTLTNSKQSRLTVGCLPDEVSRYNCTARPECIQRVVNAAKMSSSATNAVLFVLDTTAHALPAVNALARCFHLYGAKSGGKRSSGTIRIATVDRHGKAIKIPATARDTAAATREAARLGDSPPTDMNPEAMAKEARKLLKGIKGVRCREIVGAKLLDNKLGGLHAVGRTAVKAPRLFLATYTPTKRSKKSQHIALVGKGITYDTGGLSMKSPAAMTTMKADMGGSAATLGAFQIAAREAGPHKISLLLCLAENAVGPTAYKPDDILTMHSGKTVEVNNTDAEGRIVLADGVSYAARVLKCDTIFDAATLTGAQLVSTGNNHAAVFSNDAKLESAVVAAGYSSGDMVHPLMFAPELYKREFRSAIADMKNSVRNRSNAQCSCAAQFIYWHIEDTDAKWCHVDLAGPAFISERATGFGTALLSETIRRL
jgi:probable aminopeptidase NPEPL1